MNSKQVVFLDTSIQIERFIGSKERQAQIRQALQNADVQFVTSFYVFMEFQRSLWADFIYILPTFLTQQRNKLQSIVDYLVVHPRYIKDQTRVERLLAAVLENPQAALGQSACWPLGDIVIALQVPTNASLWTLDADFQPLLDVLGLQMYRPTFSSI